MQAIDSQRATHIDVIDGLRGMAILAVMFHHIVPSRFPLLTWHATWFYGLRFAPLTLFSNGHLGVVMFFILSGFVLTLPYALGRRTMQTRQDVLAFYRRRARRLLPLYFFNVFLLMTLVGPVTNPRTSLMTLLPLVTLSFPLFTATRSPKVNGVLWSLGVEFWFCILMPWILMVTRRVSMRTILLTSIAVSLAMSGMYAYWNMTGTVRMNFVVPIMTNLIVRQVELVIGMALAFAFVRQERTSLPIGRIGVIIVLFACLNIDALRSRHLIAAASSVVNFLPGIGLGLILYSLIIKERTWTKLLFGNWSLRFIGMMCYSLYLWHFPALRMLAPHFNLFRLAQYLILVFSLSFLSYRYIEFGGTRDLRLLLPRRSGKPTASEHLDIVSR